MEDAEKQIEDKIPPYVCCVLTEETWTWFAAILFFVILLLIATLKYCRKYLSKPKFQTKNLSCQCTPKISEKLCQIQRGGKCQMIKFSKL